MHNVEFLPTEFCKFIGQMINPKEKSFVTEKANKFSFKVGNLIVEIPNATSSNDTLTRVIKTFQSITKQMFAGYELEEEVKDENYTLLLSSLQHAGIKFSNYSKISVNTGLQIWANNKRLKVALMQEPTMEKNMRLSAQNSIMRDELGKVQIIRKANEEKVKDEEILKIQMFLPEKVAQVEDKK